MNIKTYLKAFSIFFISFVLFIFLITIFYYFDLLNPTIMKISKISILLISSFFSGFFIGKKSEKKGYLNGLILGLFIITCFLLINLFLKSLRGQQIIYFIILLIVTTAGSMIGINKKQ